MRENPSLVPEKMVAFKKTKKTSQEDRKKTWAQGGKPKKNGHPTWSSLRLSLSWMWAGVGHPMSVRQSCRVLSDSPHSCVHILRVLRHCTSISSAALCEENTRCWVWSLILATRCHGNTNQTAACTGGGRQEVREQGGMNGQGSTQARCQSNRRMWRNSSRLGDVRTCSKVLQGERAMTAT